ncbi:unnamed protein product [Periconia digitata]|uniref:Uncharacterized protein n=1 Tax=Periconia digitata TaxID=1303443 RepID=A0A9W4XHL9_9PLEO|nr:unnamed protein product [Periconia digitata]
MIAERKMHGTQGAIWGITIYEVIVLPEIELQRARRMSMAGVRLNSGHPLTSKDQAKGTVFAYWCENRPSTRRQKAFLE